MGSGTPTLPDVLRQAIEAKLLDVHTMLPAQVVTYDAATGEADIQPVIKKKYVDGDVQDMPIIASVPVSFQRGATYGLSLPLAPGDYGTLVFAERSIDKWLTNGGIQEPGDPRKFDLSDAVFYPGAYPFSETPLDTVGTNMAVIFGTGKVVINPDGKIAIGNDVQELLDVIEQFIDALVALTIATGIGAQPPLNLATFIALQPKIAALKGVL